MPSRRSGSKFTADRRKAIVDGIRSGLPRRLAAARAGIVKQTFYNWLDEGAKNPDGAYGRFVADVDAAEAAFAADILEKWTGAIPDDWRAGMELLSRRLPDEYGKRERHEVTGAAGEPIKIEVTWPGTTPG